MTADRDRVTTLPVRRGLSRAEAAHYIGISAPTFDRLVAAGSMPKPIRIFSRLVWDRWAVDKAFTRLSEGTVDDAAETEKWAM